MFWFYVGMINDGSNNIAGNIAQNMLGSAKMVLETGKHPGELKDMVCSPAGTTIEAVRVLEEKGFRSAVIEAMKACVKKAKEIGMKIILNPSPMNEKIKELPLDQINYFLLNEIEAMQILDMEEPKEIDGKYISGLLHQKFPKATIVLTLGSEGSVCISGDEYVEQSIYKVKTVDTTAAGDTYTGYFIAGILNGKTIKEAMDTASKASAIAVSRQGAAPSIPYLKEVEEYKN